MAGRRLLGRLTGLLLACPHGAALHVPDRSSCLVDRAMRRVHPPSSSPFIELWKGTGLDGTGAKRRRRVAFESRLEAQQRSAPEAPQWHGSSTGISTSSPTQSTE